MGLEGERAGGESVGARLRHRSLQHRLMPAVHAVEIADGEGEALVLRRE